MNNKLCGYECVNTEKLERAILGSMASGVLEGGVGEGASDEVKLAKYDSLGGFIKNKDGYKVKTGSFFDFVKGKADFNQGVKAKPDVVLILQGINGIVEIAEEKGIPLEVKAMDAKVKKDLEVKKGKRVKKAKKDDE